MTFKAHAGPLISLTEELLELEKKLVDPELRSTPERLAPLLADDFIEFGSGGHAYDKKRVLFVLKRLAPAEIFIEEFRVIKRLRLRGSGYLPRLHGIDSCLYRALLVAQFAVGASRWRLANRIPSGDECSRCWVMHLIKGFVL